MGDIHGAAKAVVQCLERSKFNKDTDTLIQLGDVADGWSGVKDAVDLLIAIPRLIPIKGNHDFWANEWFLTGVAQPYHQKQGGQATIDSYKNDKYETDIPESHRHFFRNQLYYHQDNIGRVFVHGGFNRKLTLREQLHDDPENFFWDRDLWTQALSYKEYGVDTRGAFKYAEPIKEVFIGHTPTLSWKTDKPMNAANIWNLDTGAGYYGKLTIMDIDSHEYYQSDPVQELYPDELGRRKR